MFLLSVGRETPPLQQSLAYKISIVHNGTMLYVYPVSIVVVSSDISSSTAILLTLMDPWQQYKYAE